MSRMAIAAPRQTGSALLLAGCFTLLCLALLTLFTDVQLRTAGLKLKPFDGVALAVLPPMFLMFLMAGCLRLTSATLLFLAYIAVHTASAFSLGNANGVRELIQSAELVFFFVVVQAALPYIAWRSVGKLLVVGLSVLVVYTIAWHVSQGYYAGWKRLDGPKLAFLVLPTIALAFMVFNRSRFTSRDYAVLSLIFVVVLFSGERKALLHVIAIMMVLLALKYVDLTRFLLGFALVVCAGYCAVMMNDYVANQFNSIVGIGSDELVSSAELQAGLIPTTMSNAQRIFANGVSEYLISVHPILGIGSNGFLVFILDTYPDASVWLQVGIHNEFIRVLVENGLLGLAVFSAIWLRTAAWLWFNWARLSCAHRATYLCFLSSAFFEAAFEGSGNEVFLFVALVAMMPDIFAPAVAPARKRFHGGYGQVAGAHR